jgi:hypothetical protein
MKKVLALLAISSIGFSNACLLISPGPSATEQVSGSVVYYYLVSPGESVPQQGSVSILSDDLVLSPASSAVSSTLDIREKIFTAVQAMISDTRNNALVGNLIINDLDFRDGHVDLALQGDVFAAGDVVLIAVRMMILLTVFSDGSVQTALVTLNGKNIVNMGISFSGNALPEDYMVSRFEIETFKTENAYPSP